MYSLGPIRTLLASFLFCDRPIAGDVRDVRGDTVPSSAFRVGNVAVERSYRACGSSYLIHQCQIGERRCRSIRTQVYTRRTTWGGLIPCYFPIRPIGQFLNHVISGNIKHRPRYMNYYNNTINCLTWGHSSPRVPTWRVLVSLDLLHYFTPFL